MSNRRLLLGCENNQIINDKQWHKLLGDIYLDPYGSNQVYFYYKFDDVTSTDTFVIQKDQEIFSIPDKTYNALTYALPNKRIAWYMNYDQGLGSYKHSLTRIQNGYYITEKEFEEIVLRDIESINSDSHRFIISWDKASDESDQLSIRMPAIYNKTKSITYYPYYQVANDIQSHYIVNFQYRNGDTKVGDIDTSMPLGSQFFLNKNDDHIHLSVYNY